MDTQYKKLIPCIYLKDCKAVKSLADHESAEGGSGSACSRL